MTMFLKDSDGEVSRTIEDAVYVGEVATRTRPGRHGLFISIREEDSGCYAATFLSRAQTEEIVNRLIEALYTPVTGSEWYDELEESTND